MESKVVNMSFMFTVSVSKNIRGCIQFTLGTDGSFVSWLTGPDEAMALAGAIVETCNSGVIREYGTFEAWYAALLRIADRHGLMEATISAGQEVWKEDYDVGVSPEFSFQEGFSQ